MYLIYNYNTTCTYGNLNVVLLQNTVFRLFIVSPALNENMILELYLEHLYICIPN